jgi:glycosyltransferase involved in cell wall biosynthesis
MTDPMDVLVAHNYYRQPGGEDEVFESEARLLESRGHRAIRFTMHNDESGRIGRPALAAATIWNRRSYARIRDLIRVERPAVVHLHNTFPLISPSAYAAAQDGGCAVVQTLHNYRLVCPNGLLFRAGRPCEECLGRSVAWPAVLHKCYRQSRAAGAVSASMLAVHHAAGTYRRMVDAYIAPSEFVRKKLILGGLPGEKIHVKPHFVSPDPGLGLGAGGFALFVGRFSPGKGIDTLLAAWPLLSGPRRIALKIIGDGEMADQVRQAAGGCPNIEWLGRKPSGEVRRIMGDAACLIHPSECYETFGLVVIEAFSKGTPVIAADHGAAGELVAGSGAGLLFRAGDPHDLARKVEELIGGRADAAGMRLRSREEYEARYTGDRNYEQLMDIYQRALSRVRSVGEGS